jgi:hypothetical protein
MQVRGTLAICVYLRFAGTTWSFQAQGIQDRNLVGVQHIMCLRCLAMKHDWTDGTKKRWSRLFVYCNWPIVLLFLPRSLNILFRNLYFMNLILSTRQQPLAYQSGMTKKSWNIAPWTTKYELELTILLEFHSDNRWLYNYHDLPNNKQIFLLFLVLLSSQLPALQENLNLSKWNIHKLI